MFAPFVAIEGDEGRALLTGLVGAAEALARDMHDGTTGDRAAIDALATMMLGTLEPRAHSEA